MRSNYMMAALAAAAMSMPSMVILGRGSGRITMIADADIYGARLVATDQLRAKAHQVPAKLYSGSSQGETVALQTKSLPGSTKVRYRRPKRAQAKPRSKPNRTTIGRRVRRKHRRAA